MTLFSRVLGSRNKRHRHGVIILGVLASVLVLPFLFHMNNVDVIKLENKTVARSPEEVKPPRPGPCRPHQVQSRSSVMFFVSLMFIITTLFVHFYPGVPEHTP